MRRRGRRQFRRAACLAKGVATMACTRPQQTARRVFAWMPPAGVNDTTNGSEGSPAAGNPSASP